MTGSRLSFTKKTTVLFASLAAYLLTSLFHLEHLSNILSSLSAYAAGGILFFAYLKSDRKIRVSLTLLFYSFACLSWGIADTVWTVSNFMGGNPDDNRVLWVIYALTNCFIIVSLVIFAFYQFRKWDLVQSAIDVVASGFLSIASFWILFLHKDWAVLNELLNLDFTSILSILTDIIICISILSWLLSVRSGKIPAFIRIITFGVILFAIADMLYYYIDFNGLYSQNSLVDMLYATSLIFIAFGALWKTYKNSSAYELNIVTNIGKRIRWIFLLLYPAVVTGFIWSGLSDMKLTVNDYILLLVPIIVYWALCKYVQVSIEKEAILKRQNKLLEQRVSEQVNELAFLANQDTLTTLYNRRYFMGFLDDTLANKSAGDLTAIFLIDMDRFKTINDSFGHDFGDRVLLNVSTRLIDWNSYNAIIARLGNDEFAVLLNGSYSKDDIENFCRLIIQCFKQPITVSEVTLNLTISLGVSITENEVCDGNTLMQRADIAMHFVKSQGYNKYLFYDPLMSRDFKKSVEIEILLKQADMDRDFELFYQPQYRLPEMELIGAEALIRWKNPEHGYIPPSVFIPIAEQIDYINKIGRWVMQTAMKQAVVWNSQYRTHLKIGFNVSPKQLKDEEFIDQIKSLICECEVNPEWIDVEITESTMMSNEDNLDEKLTVLRGLGVSVSIDDFGSGYSALGYLNKYHFDKIKIDKTLIDNLACANINGSGVVRAAIEMAHASGIKTVAEGVERKEQLDVLIELGCDKAQGYFLGRPLPADVFEKTYIR